MQRAPDAQIELAKCAATVDFPLPGMPETKTLEPLKYPLPSSIASRSGMPLETRSLEASCASPAEVIGITVIPCWSIMKGYSFVPCAEPRYLTSRRRRVDN